MLFMNVMLWNGEVRVFESIMYYVIQTKSPYNTSL